MKEYKGLKYKTRGNASPQGRPRVFFCCHPNDFERMFEPITNEILDIQINAAIWYYDPKEGIPDGENFLADLSQMQLFVVPVTVGFLFKKNDARTVEFAFAAEHHIPILPLMQEPGLENDFNRICGDLQFLDKNAASNDPTALPYEDKLKKYLASVLVSDELAQKIRDAFDAYIFLSYRKKDRKHAQQIMRLIHKNDFCRDIAIWYDEFLTPGENFNDAIEAAMQKSSLFALVVTPSLLENPNYVMTVEYPEAKKTGKPILPIEGLSTDEGELAKLYEGIDTTLRSEQVSERLHELLKGITLTTDKKDPSHSFLIGLAYLSGIDVETDYERALSLITSAAEEGVPEAYEKLVSMYQNGEGVERNYNTAVEWQKRYVKYLENAYEQCKEAHALDKLIDSILELGDYQRDCRKLIESKETYQAMLKRAEEFNTIADGRRYFSFIYNRLGNISLAEGKLEEAKTWHLKDLENNKALATETDTIEPRRSLSSTYINLGDISNAEGKLKEAKEWYLKSLEISKAIVTETDTIESRMNLSTSYNRFGDISKAEGNPEDAKEWYLKALEIDKALATETDSIVSRRDLYGSYTRLGDISESESNLKEAKDWYLKGFEIAKALGSETESIESHRYLSVSYSRLGDISQAEGNLEEAKDWYLKALEIDKALATETDTIESRCDLSICYIKLGDIGKAEGKPEEAMTWYLRAREISMELAKETNTIQHRRILYISYLNLGDISQSENYLEEAKAWFLKSLEISKEIAVKTNTIESCQDLTVSFNRLGNLSLAEGKLEEAKTCYINAFEIDKVLATVTDTIQSRQSLSSSYINLGTISKAEGDLEEAKDWHLKAVDICTEIAEETNTVESRKNLSDNYNRLGDISEAEGNLEEAKDWYLKALEISKALVTETNTVEFRKNLSDSYNRLGNISLAEGNLEETIDWYLKAIDIRTEIAEKTNTIESLDDLAISCLKFGVLSIIPSQLRRKILEQFLLIGTYLYENAGLSRYRSLIEIAEEELEKLKTQKKSKMPFIRKLFRFQLPTFSRKD